MLVTELQQTNAAYNPPISMPKGGKALFALETYSDFYSGGRNFELRKDRYLRTRPIEAVDQNGNYRSNRLSSAYYTPHAGGIGDNLCGTALQSPPVIECDSQDDPRADYWRGLNENADGKGGDLRAQGWKLIKSLIIHKRAYIAVNFPDAENPDDATFTALCAADVDDWQCDDNGKLEFVRTHCVDLVRASKFGPQTIERHTWTFYTDSEVQEFTAERKIGADWAPDQMATAGEAQPHGLGEVPIYPIEVEDDFWVMDRLWSTAHAYFNREASRSFSIDTGALSLPVIETRKDVGSLVQAQGFCIKIDIGDKFYYASPDSGIYGALKDDCDYLLGNLYGAINQMALTAASQAGNPRQSGTAKTADSAAIKAFLSLLTAPVIAAMRRAVKAVQTFRDEEELKVEVHGMNNFDVQSIELEITRCATFTVIPAVAQRSPTAVKESIKRAVRAYLPDIDEESAEKIREELDKEPEQPMPLPATGEAVPGIANATTGRPQGFAPGQISQQSKPAVQQIPRVRVLPEQRHIFEKSA